MHKLRLKKRYKNSSRRISIDQNYTVGVLNKIPPNIFMGRANFFSEQFIVKHGFPNETNAGLFIGPWSQAWSWSIYMLFGSIMVCSRVEQKSFNYTAFLQIWTFFFDCCCTNWSSNGARLNSIAQRHSNLKHSWKTHKGLGKIAVLEFSQVDYIALFLGWMKLCSAIVMTSFHLAIMKCSH